MEKELKKTPEIVGKQAKVTRFSNPRAGYKWSGKVTIFGTMKAKRFILIPDVLRILNEGSGVVQLLHKKFLLICPID